MDIFYTGVISIAIIILIIIFIIIGVMIYQSANNTVFPPTALECPNYWALGTNTEGKHICYIPTNGTNMGSLKDTTKIHGIGSDTNGSFINFNDPSWGSNAYGATCAKQNWANKNAILWDGISNFNGCPTSSV
jgi:hypothetical protein